MHGRIVGMRRCGVTALQIAKIERCSVATVYNAVARDKADPSTTRHLKLGRPSKVTRQLRTRIVQLALDSKVGTIRRIQDTLRRDGTSLALATIWRALHDAGMRSVHPQRKPDIRDVNCVKRASFSEEHIEDTIEDENEFWDDVVFSDEKSFELNSLVDTVWIGNYDDIPTLPNSKRVL